MSEKPNITTAEMLKAWNDFKQSALFANLMAGLPPGSEGTAWAFFYNGYVKGATR